MYNILFHYYKRNYSKQINRIVYVIANEWDNCYLGLSGPISYIKRIFYLFNIYLRIMPSTQNHRLIAYRKLYLSGLIRAYSNLFCVNIDIICFASTTILIKIKRTLSIYGLESSIKTSFISILLNSKRR